MPRRATPAKVMRKAQALLEGLLRSPKTREGLIAAAATLDLSAKFVYGWLTAAVQSGHVLKHRAGVQITYSLASSHVDEPVAASEYPAWLDPRSLPTYTGAHTHVCVDEDPDQQNTRREQHATHRRP